MQGAVPFDRALDGLGVAVRFVSTMQLKDLRTLSKWGEAKEALQKRIESLTHEAVDERVKSFLATYAGRAPAAVLDVVLSSQRDWMKRVRPSVEKWSRENESKSLRTLASETIPPMIGNVTLRKFESQTVSSIATELVTFGEFQSDDDTRFREWAEQAQRWRYHCAFDPIGRIKGIGTTLFNYLLMRGGVDALKPDLRVARFFRGLGLPIQDTPRAEDVLVLAEAMAQELGVQRIWLDQLIWTDEQ